MRVERPRFNHGVRLKSALIGEFNNFPIINSVKLISYPRYLIYILYIFDPRSVVLYLELPRYSRNLRSVLCL